MAADNAMA